MAMDLLPMAPSCALDEVGAGPELQDERTVELMAAVGRLMRRG